MMGNTLTNNQPPARVPAIACSALSTRDFSSWLRYVAIYAIYQRAGRSRDLFPLWRSLPTSPSGGPIEELLADYPDLEREDIFAALAFGARMSGGRVVPLSVA